MNNCNIFEEIYSRNIKHTTFVDKDSIMKSIEEAYILGFNKGVHKNMNQGQNVLDSVFDKKK